MESTNPTPGFEKAKVIDLDASINYSSHGVISKQILKDKNGNVTLFSFDKGQSFSEHTAPFDAIVHVIEGVGEVIINGSKYRLTAGQMIVMPANVPHAVSAPEQFKMILTMIKD